MTTAMRVPDARALGEFLRMFLATAPTVEKSKQPRLPASFSLATYSVEPSGEALGWGTDLPSSARLAAALSMLPEGVVDECLRAKALSDPLRDNLYEVFNVGLSLFSDGKHRVRMESVKHGLSHRFRTSVQTVGFDLKWPSGVVTTTFFAIAPAHSLLVAA